MNRRNFFFRSAALAAPFAVSPAVAAASDDIKLGVATYSLRQFQRDLCIKMVQQLGVEYVDIKEFHLPQSESAKATADGRKKFDDAGLKVVGGGNVGLPESDEAGMRKHFEYAKAAGFPMIICAPRTNNLRVVEKLAKEFDIRIAIHNHGPEDNQFPSPQSVLAAVKDMDPRMGLCMDIGHTTRAGKDPVEAIALAGPRLFELHMKDLKDLMGKAPGSSFGQCPVGEGAMPIPAIFRQLKKVNYQGVCSLEYEIDADNPMPGMMKSFAYMRGVLAGLKSA
jgi:sugar phosphate isomerase/epimerase